mmetsp:Transcript_106354/g.183733  ORF Transcript_106354/g.183733 Transcript_106354/m.183733 type:complete len:332 (-) Transcript_106354:211-1206(-)
MGPDSQPMVNLQFQAKAVLRTFPPTVPVLWSNAGSTAARRLAELPVRGVNRLPEPTTLQLYVHGEARFLCPNEDIGARSNPHVHCSQLPRMLQSVSNLRRIVKKNKLAVHLRLQVFPQIIRSICGNENLSCIPLPQGAVQLCRNGFGPRRCFLAGPQEICPSAVGSYVHSTTQDVSDEILPSLAHGLRKEHRLTKSQVIHLLAPGRIDRVSSLQQNRRDIVASSLDHSHDVFNCCARKRSAAVFKCLNTSFTITSIGHPPALRLGLPGVLGCSSASACAIFQAPAPAVEASFLLAEALILCQPILCHHDHIIHKITTDLVRILLKFKHRHF